MGFILSPIRLNSLSPAPDLETLEITLTSSLPSITGLIKIESTTNTKPISEELSCIPSVPSTMPVCLTSLGCMPSLPLEDWPDGPDTTEILTWKSIFQNYRLPKSSKLSGTELQSLSED